VLKSAENKPVPHEPTRQMKMDDPLGCGDGITDVEKGAA
jgi:hypothetical protein